MGRNLQFSRDEKLRQAMNVFHHHGFANTSMAELLAQLKINRFSLYNTFGDKQTLFTAALEAYFSDVIEPVLQPLYAPEAGLDEIVGFFDQFVARQRLQPEGCLIQNTLLEQANRDPAVLAVAGRLFTLLEQAFSQVLSQDAARGRLTANCHPQQLSRFLIIQLQGIRVLGKARQFELLEEGIKPLRALLLSYKVR